MRILLPLLFLVSCTPSLTESLGAVGKLHTARWVGTAFPVKHTSDGFIALTCWHLTRGQEGARLELGGKVYTFGEILFEDKEQDTALLKFKTVDRPTLLELSGDRPRPLAKGITLGFPIDRDVVFAVPVLFQKQDLEICAMTAGGSSGGPVFLGLRVVGMISQGRSPFNYGCPHGSVSGQSYVSTMSDLTSAIAELAKL